MVVLAGNTVVATLLPWRWYWLARTALLHCPAGSCVVAVSTPLLVLTGHVHSCRLLHVVLMSHCVRLCTPAEEPLREIMRGMLLLLMWRGLCYAGV